MSAVSVHRLREAVGPMTLLPISKVLAITDGNDYHYVYALLLTPEQHRDIMSAIENRGNFDDSKPYDYDAEVGYE